MISDQNMLNTFPCITLWQPWATWIALGWKTIETRTHKRFQSLVGQQIGIHAGKRMDLSELIFSNPFLTKQQIADTLACQHGQIVCSAFVRDFRILTAQDSKAALIDCGETLRYGLILDNIKPFKSGIKINGSSGIFYIDPTWL